MRKRGREEMTEESRRGNNKRTRKERGREESRRWSKGVRALNFQNTYNVGRPVRQIPIYED